MLRLPRRFETPKASSERIIAGELARLGWDAGQLQLRRKNDPQKLSIAAGLRRGAPFAAALGFRLDDAGL
jgi:hypothetical protein